MRFTTSDGIMSAKYEVDDIFSIEEEIEDEDGDEQSSAETDDSNESESNTGGSDNNIGGSDYSNPVCYGYGVWDCRWLPSDNPTYKEYACE